MRLLCAAAAVPWAEVLASPGTWARPRGWGEDGGLRAGLVPCDADPTAPDCLGDTKEVPLPDSGAQPGPHLQVGRRVVSSWVAEREAWTELLGPWASRLLGSQGGQRARPEEGSGLQLVRCGRDLDLGAQTYSQEETPSCFGGGICAPVPIRVLAICTSLIHLEKSNLPNKKAKSQFTIWRISGPPLTCTGTAIDSTRLFQGL